MVPGVAGSNPVSHPIFKFTYFLPIRSIVNMRTISDAEVFIRFVAVGVIRSLLPVRSSPSLELNSCSNRWADPFACPHIRRPPLNLI